MKSRTRIVAAWIYGLLAVGCSDDPTLTRKSGPLPTPTGQGGSAESSGGSSATSEPIAFCDALMVVRAKCQRCHGDPLQNAAPVPFLTYEDTQAQYYMSTQKWSDMMRAAVRSGFMPYVALNEPPNPITPPVEALTAEEKATLLGWLEEGAQPEGGTDCR